MAYLKISYGDLSLEIDKISQYDLAEFSLKNQYTGENGNTIIYPVRMHKKEFQLLLNFPEVPDYRRKLRDIAENTSIL